MFKNMKSFCGQYCNYLFYIKQLPVLKSYRRGDVFITCVKLQLLDPLKMCRDFETLLLFCSLSKLSQSAAKLLGKSSTQKYCLLVQRAYTFTWMAWVNFKYVTISVLQKCSKLKPIYKTNACFLSTKDFFDKTLKQNMFYENKKGRCF